MRKHYSCIEGYTVRPSKTWKIGPFSTFVTVAWMTRTRLQMLKWNVFSMFQWLKIDSVNHLTLPGIWNWAFCLSIPITWNLWKYQPLPGWWIGSSLWHFLVAYERPSTPYCPSYHLPGLYSLWKTNIKQTRVQILLWWSDTSYVFLHLLGSQMSQAARYGCEKGICLLLWCKSAVNASCHRYCDPTTS